MKIIYYILLIFSVFSLHAQKYHGYVENETKEAIYGAKISCGTNQLTSDWNGRFELNNSGNDTVLIQATGYEEQRILLSKLSKKFIHITLRAVAQEIKEVVITKNRFENFDIGYLPPVKGVQIATGTNTIIQTENQGGAKSSANPRELFAKVPGLNIWESDGAGIQMGVGGRGLSPNRTANFNTRQNGYDISADALGYPESYYTPPLEALSSIEIIRGSASLQYGTQFGGLMNFIIKDPAKNSPFEFTSRATVGSFGYKAGFFRFSGTKNKFEYQTYYQYKEGTGYRKNSLFDQHQYFAQFGYHISDRQSLRLEYTHMTYNAQQPGGLTDKQFYEDPIQSVRNRNWFNVTWNLLALHYNFAIRPSLLFNIRTFGIASSRQSLGFLGKINQQDPGNERQLIFGDFKNTGTEARLLKKYDFTLFNKKMKGASLVGARFYIGETSALQGNAPVGTSADFRFTSSNELENSAYLFPSNNLSLFTEHIWFLGDRATFNIGFRYEHITSASKGYYKVYAIHNLTQDTLAIQKFESSNSLTRSVPLGGLGFSYKTTKQTNLYANFCMNYRAVNFSDIRVTNPNLLVDSTMRDEFGSTTEIGFRGFIFPSLYIDAAAFHIYYGDKIGIAPVANSFKKIRTNIGNARNIGIECLVEFDFIKAIKDSATYSSAVFVNFSYIDAHYVTSKEKNFIGKHVEYVSPILWKTGLNLKHARWGATIQGSYNAAQFSDASNSIEPSGDAVIGEVPAYFVMDMSAKYNFKKWFTLEGGINNLLNESYFTRRAAAYPGPGILPSDGRNFYVTLQFKIGERK
jgi:Fe(3+) dicitrate transport protein